MKTPKTITHRNRIYTVIETTDINEYPHIAKLNDKLTHTFIAEGKRGALISGCFFSNGEFNIF